MTETYDPLDRSLEDEKAHSRRPKWVAWLVGGSVATLVLLGLAVAAFSYVVEIESEPMGPALVTDPSELSMLSSDREEYEQEWERQHGREYSPSRTTYEGDGVGVVENLDPPLEPTESTECTPVRDTTTVASTPITGESGAVTAAPLTGPAEMDCG